MNNENDCASSDATAGFGCITSVCLNGAGKKLTGSFCGSVSFWSSHIYLGLPLCSLVVVVYLLLLLLFICCCCYYYCCCCCCFCSCCWCCCFSFFSFFFFFKNNYFIFHSRTTQQSTQVGCGGLAWDSTNGVRLQNQRGWVFVQ